MGRTQTKGINATQGVVWRQLLAYFFPILLGTFFQQLYNTADAMIVGRLVGPMALAAVGGVTGNLVNFIVNLLVGLSSGATVAVAQLFGAGHAQQVGKTVHTALMLALTAGAGFTLLGQLAAGPALRAMGTPGEVLPYAVTYLRIVLLGVIPSFLYNMGAGVLRAVGDTRRPLYFLICACLTNILLDLLLVAGAGMGIAGAALATILSQLLSAALVLASLAATHASYRFVPRRLRFDKAALFAILRVGVPAGLQSNMYTVSNILIQTSVNSFGPTVMAAWTAHGKMDGFFWMIMGAYGVAMTTFAGQNFGARRYDRIRQSVRACLLMAGGTAAVFSSLYCLLAPQLLAIFTSDAQVLELAVWLARWVVPFNITYIFIEVLASAIRGCGEALPPMLMVGGGVCLLRILWIFAMLPHRAQLDTILFSYPLSWIATSLLFIGYYLHGGWLRRCTRRSGQE